VACRLDDLRGRVEDEVGRASLRHALLGRLQRAGAKSALAAAQMTTGGQRRARSSLRRAARALIRFRRALRSRADRHALASAKRSVFRRDARRIQTDLRALRQQL
jgi:hypothetical protein